MTDLLPPFCCDGHKILDDLTILHIREVECIDLVEQVPKGNFGVDYFAD